MLSEVAWKDGITYRDISTKMFESFKSNIFLRAINSYMSLNLDYHYYANAKGGTWFDPT